MGERREGWREKKGPMLQRSLQGLGQHREQEGERAGGGTGYNFGLLLAEGRGGLEQSQHIRARLPKDKIGSKRSPIGGIVAESVVTATVPQTRRSKRPS